MLKHKLFPRNPRLQRKSPFIRSRQRGFALDQHIPLNNRNQTNVDEIETISSPFHINVRC